jgi:hypothetical protein
MRPLATLLSVPGLPWRIRNSLTLWTEGRVRERHAALYRWLHFGDMRNRIEPLTFGPKHHFFGYYEKSPWNASQTRMLAHEVDFNDRAPQPDDRLTLGLIHLPDKRFHPVAETLAWNWQQGAMLQWHPDDRERLFLHNDRRADRFVGVVRDTEGAEIRVYDRPIYAVLPDGKTAHSVNFARLADLRPGYGYAGLVDAFADDPHPAEDGLWQIDLVSGESRLAVSLDALASRQPKATMRDGMHYINHVQPSRSGRWIAFFHIWTVGERGWEVRLYVCRPDGSELRCLLDSGKVSHYDWHGDDAILVWANHPETGKPHFLHLPLDGAVSIFGGQSLSEDGHCTFSPDRRWVLNDTYPDRFDMRTLMLVKWPGGERTDIARLHSPKSKWWGEVRCDLHPRWSPYGKQVCIDSVHEGTRQMYVINMSELML